MRLPASLALVVILGSAPTARSQEQSRPEAEMLREATAKAQEELRQTFTNLQFEDFGPAPVKGQLYQANAGGRIIYFAPESDHLLFAAIYDRNGLNVTALAQDGVARRRLAAIDTSDALAIGPADAPEVIEFTDPDCPYCRALETYWLAKIAEGKPVRRLVYFVTGIHPGAAAKAEHILCSPDRDAAFRTIYAGGEPDKLLTCPEGREKLVRDAKTVAAMAVSGTPTVIAAGKQISGFRQDELEAFLATRYPPSRH